MNKYFFISLIFLSLISCEKDTSNSDNSNNLKTIEINIKNCYKGFENSSICFDSILYDSRCPKGGVCCWEGNAAIKIDVELNNSSHQIVLNTNANYKTDTIIDFLYISLLELNPYPEIGKDKKASTARAKLLIADLNHLKSNAQILNFNAEKCECCWGWTIKTENDTIKSDDSIVGAKIGYCVNSPINVYVEFGDMDNYSCNLNGGKKYYKIKRIIKMK
jgi:hypothetical protein